MPVILPLAALFGFSLITLSFFGDLSEKVMEVEKKQNAQKIEKVVDLKTTELEEN